MKGVLFLGLGLMMFGAAFAAEPNYSEVEVVSVIPRSPDVKPIPMSLPAEGRQKQAARNDVAANAATGKAPAETDSEERLQKAHRDSSNPQITRATVVENYLRRGE